MYLTTRQKRIFMYRQVGEDTKMMYPLTVIGTFGIALYIYMLSFLRPKDFYDVVIATVFVVALVSLLTIIAGGLKE